MHVLILGGGIIGVTSAYYLARQGHQVSVLDRQPGCALETSFANAGQISPGYAAPWAAPGIPLKAIKWMLSKHSPLVINPRPEWDKLKFLIQLFAQCNANDYSRNKGRMLRLAEYSRSSLVQLQQQEGLDYDGRSLGTLQLFRTPQQIEASRKDMALLDQFQVPYQALDTQGCIAAEPALARVRNKIVGGLRLPLDQTGDCYKLTVQLTEQCRHMGVNFLYGSEVKSIAVEQGRIQYVNTSHGRLGADRFVMAMGSYSTRMLKTLGINIPVYPVKGYSITVPVINPDAAPLSTLMDESHKVAITRLGDRIRVAGTAELNGYNLQLNQKRRATVRHVVADLFPDAADLSQDDFWSGLRPMTPDGTPIIGATQIDNLYLNTGHGTLGWTMSFGSGRLLADLISGRQPDIKSADLSLQRYARGFRSNSMQGKLVVTR